MAIMSLITLATYATGYSQTITETISTVSAGSGYVQQMPEAISQILVGPGYLRQLSEKISDIFVGPGNTQTNQEVMFVCANSSSFNNCGYYVAFSMAGSGVEATITLSGCNVTPTSIAGDGKAHAVTISSGCEGITATLPSGYAFSGNGTLVVSETTSTETLKLLPTWVAGSAYIAIGKPPTVTVTHTVLVIIVSHVNNATNTSQAVSNETAQFIGYVMPPFLVIGLFVWAAREKMDVKDPRVLAIIAIISLYFVALIGLLSLYIPIIASIFGLGVMLEERYRAGDR